MSTSNECNAAQGNPIGYSDQDSPGACSEHSKIHKDKFDSSLYPDVKMREKRPQTTQDKSEAQRKRNSKNRLSNRKSTGFVSPGEVEAAAVLGQPEPLDSNNKTA